LILHIEKKQLIELPELELLIKWKSYFWFWL